MFISTKNLKKNITDCVQEGSYVPMMIGTLAPGEKYGKKIREIGFPGFRGSARTVYNYMSQRLPVILNLKLYINSKLKYGRDRFRQGELTKMR